MKTLQIATTDTRSFFNKQVEFLEKKGVDCDVLALSPGRYKYQEIVDDLGLLGKVLPEPGYTTRYAAVNTAISYPRTLAKSITNDYDIIHSNGGLSAPFAALQPERPVVQTFWGSDLMGNYAFNQYDKVCKGSAKHFDASIVRNEEMKNALKGYDDAHVIPAGVDLDLFCPIDCAKAREKLNWSNDIHYVLFPYRPWNRRKNIELALKVVQNAREALSDLVHLQIVHDEPFEMMPYYFNASDALILPSKLEGSPNTVKEAMACNTPVVSTDVGDVSQLLRNVDNSTVANEDSRDTEDTLTDGLIRAVQEGNSPNGRDQVRHLGWEKTAEKIIDVYDDVV